jgi:glycosyltransferase involved in cell wall biosynthesis
MLTVQPAVRSRLPKVALYEPSGHGGIAHYTFELAEGLHRAGWAVTVLTAEGYELETLERPFDVRHVIKASRLKAILSRWRSSASAEPAAAGPAAAPAPVAAPSPQAAPGRSRDSVRSRVVAAIKTMRFVSDDVKTLMWLLRTGTRVVHVQWLVDRRADLLFLRLLRLCGVAVVVTVHDVLPHDEYTDENRRYFQKLYRLADRLIVHSENNRREMLELFDLDPRRLCVIPHGAQTLFNDHFDIPRASARRDLGLPDDTRIVLFFGLIKRYKGLEYLLQAFERITARCGNVTLLIAGKIYDGDADVHRHYTSLLSSYRMRSDVRLDSGYIPIEQVSRYFAAADLVVLPYVKASQSGVLLSAYAAGRPVVVTDTGGLGEVVERGVSGLVVPPQDADALAEASIAVLNDPEALRNMGREAKRLAETTYSWANVAAATGAMYRSLR